ncbi:MAG: CarD family transcriptional regulator [Rhodobacteraceae bacterium]|nr:CarD family transcriptional regulator [Paracoccaceae bacterium]
MKDKKTAGRFSVGDHVVYPSHGVGIVEKIESQEVAGSKMELIVIVVEKDQMKLSIPTKRVGKVGLRALTPPKELDETLKILGGRARIKKSMWSKRAQEYDQKINSGSIKELTEVVRDLHRHDKQKEQSYSERQLYESAFERLCTEVAAVYSISHEDASATLLKHLADRGRSRSAPSSGSKKAAA